MRVEKDDVKGKSVTAGLIRDGRSTKDGTKDYNRRIISMI